MLERLTAVLVLVAAALVFLLVGMAYGDVPLEEGALFDGGICWEADGTEGISTAWGDCMTPADYSETFSFENLASIPSRSNPEISIAEEAGLVRDGTEAADRELGAGVVAETFTFRAVVRAAHEPVPV